MSNGIYQVFNGIDFNWTEYPTIDPSVRFGKNLKVGVGVVIEENVVLGDDCFIGHYAMIRPRTKLGDRCDLRAYAHIENDVVMGNDVRVYQYGSVVAGAILEDKIWYGPMVMGTNTDTILVHHPDGNNWVRSSPYIKSGAIICPHSVLGPGITIGVNSVIGMGSLVRHDIPDNQIWYGRPAKYVRDLPRDLWVIREEYKNIFPDVLLDYHDELNKSNKEDFEKQYLGSFDK